MVDPITMIAMAVVKGAASALARNLVNESYQLLRRQLTDRYGSAVGASIAQVEQSPDSTQARVFLEQALRNAGAEHDHQLAAHAQQVLTVIDNGGGSAFQPEPIRRSEGLYRSTGLDRISQLLQAHVERVAAVRASHQVDDTDLLTGRMRSNRSLPKEIRQSASSLHRQIGAIVIQVAERIENTRYREVESAVSDLQASRRERERAGQLVEVDKTMHISYETLRLTVEFFGELNQEVLRRIETSGARGSQLANMMFGNAVIIYEITEFVIDYVRGFTMGNQHMTLHAEAMEWTRKARKDEAELERRINQPHIDPEVRRFTLEDIGHRTSALDELDRQWASYLAEIDNLRALVEEVKNRVPTLEIIRDNARNQITVLQATAMLRFLKTNSTSIRGAVETVQGLRLAPLTSDRVRALVGVATTDG